MGTDHFSSLSFLIFYFDIFILILRCVQLSTSGYLKSKSFDFEATLSVSACTFTRVNFGCVGLLRFLK